MGPTKPKQLKFESRLVPLVLSEQKTSTWRAFDDKNLSVGDAIELVDRGTRAIFARATITSVELKKIREITKGDQDAQGSYRTTEGIVADFKKHYGDRVDADTELKLIEFKLNEQA